MSTKKKEKKVVKGWVVVDKENGSIAIGSGRPLINEGRFNALCARDNWAANAKKFLKVVPCTITYTL